MDEFFALTSTFLGHPAIKAISILLSIASFAIGLYSLRKIHQVTSVQVQNMRAEHLRHLNDKRSEIDLVTLKDPGVADLVARNFDMGGGAAEARTEALLCLYLNVAASAYAARKNGLIGQEEYEKHMRFILDDYAGDPEYLWSVVRMNSFPSGFEKQCRLYLSAGKKQVSPRNGPRPQPVPQAIS